MIRNSYQRDIKPVSEDILKTARGETYKALSMWPYSCCLVDRVWDANLEQIVFVERCDLGNRDGEIRCGGDIAAEWCECCAKWIFRRGVWTAKARIVHVT